MKPLLNEYYCPFCEDEGNKDKTKCFAFSLLNNDLIAKYKDNILPAGTSIYLLRSEEDLQDAMTFFPPGYSPVVLNVTYEPNIVWSFILEPKEHVTVRDLPFEVLSY